jgi:hypothetical protein
MGSRIALVTVGLLLVCLGAGSCVLGHDSERPVLSVDPLWDAAESDRFLPETCKGAGVAWMTWEIQDEQGKGLEKSEDLEECKPLDFFGLQRGTYQLVLEGYDKDERKRWANTCTNLELGRFDVLYGCGVDQIPDDVTDPDEDAGTPDAGE